MVHRPSARVAATTGSVLLILALGSACAADDEGGGAKATGSDVPEGDFPAETFDGLSGELVWFDNNGGANTDARNATIWKDYTALTGVKTRADLNDPAKFLATAENGAPMPWSLIEFGGRGNCDAAADEGYLEKLDTSKVPVDQLEDGGYSEYCVSAMASGAVITWNTDKWPLSGDHPDEAADLYDLKKFPGKRCFYQYPQFGDVLESALIADGVAPEDVYPLDTERAYRKLDTIKDDIIWWNEGDEATRLFTTGECDLGITWSGRAYNAATKDGAPLAITWQDATLTTGAYGVPKGSPNLDAAQAAIAMWILDKKGQQEYVKLIPYTTPIKDIEYDKSLQPWLAAGKNLDVAIPEDVQYFDDNISELADEFNAWAASD